MKHTRNYKLVSITLDEDALELLDELVLKMEKQGVYGANKSMAIRMAIEHLVQDRNWEPDGY
jgi:metal-responsive CopG/Arc/MetJ family transcriptional regulator